MNERIQKLAEQAGLQQRVWNSLGKELPMWQEDPDNPGLDKFAELIVRECIGCCEQVISDPVPKSVDTFEQGGIHCMDEIKQHFGVDTMSTEDKKTLIKELLGVKNDTH